MFCSSVKSLYMRMILFYALPLNLSRTNNARLMLTWGVYANGFGLTNSL